MKKWRVQLSDGKWYAISPLRTFWIRFNSWEDAVRWSHAYFGAGVQHFEEAARQIAAGKGDGQRTDWPTKTDTAD